MRKMLAAKRLAAAGAASLGLVISMSSMASAETVQAGVWIQDGHAFTIRASASTSSAALYTIRNVNSRIPCTTTACTRNNDGGSYKCWSGGPADNDWLKVKWGGKTGWVAAMCVNVGRI
ncbi:hypothetical protein ABZ669_29955 [Streptomyces hirsutus]|uniref:hypothetical protein n=1 Tax=Streptomyces hirsutus TaxID=35620 RepID=UPI0033F49A25